jgi:hypothetical protein
MKHIILLTIIVFGLSCTAQKPKHYITEGIHAAKMMHPMANPDIITIDQENHETVPYTELQNVLKDVKYIPLVSKEPIGDIDKMLIYKDRIFVLDKTKAEKVFIFNMQGEIINIIDRKGGGPEEYAGLKDMNISPDEDCIVLNDRLGRFTLYFTLDGKFIRKERKIANYTFAIMQDKIINQLVRGQSYEDGLNYHLVVTTKGDSIIRRGFPFYPIQLDAVNYPPLSCNSMGEILFVPNLSDTVYQILSDSTYRVKYVVKHKKSIWEKYNQNIDHKQQTDLIMNSNYTRLNLPILETERFVSFLMTVKRQSGDQHYMGAYDYWYDKTKGIVFHLEELVTSITNSKTLEGIYHDIPSPRAIYGNYFAGVINIELIDIYKKNFVQPKYDAAFKNEELKAMLKSNNPDLEAILVLYEFK